MIEQIEVGFEKMICPGEMEHYTGKIQKIRKSAAVVDDPGSGCLFQFDPAQQGQSFFDPVPEPDRDIFRRRVFQTGNFIKQFMIHLVDQRKNGVFQYFKIHDPARIRIRCALYVNPEMVGMAMHLFAFMPFRNIGQEMGRIKTKLFIDLHTFNLGRKNNPLFQFRDDPDQAGTTFIK
jgi:hypothetical protein